MHWSNSDLAWGYIMTRLHSLVCFQRFPFPCCHFLSHKHCLHCVPSCQALWRCQETDSHLHKCTVLPHSSAPWTHSPCQCCQLPPAWSQPPTCSLQEGPTQGAASSPGREQVKRTVFVHSFVPWCRVSPGLLPAGRHILSTVWPPWAASPKQAASGSLSCKGIGHRGERLLSFCTHTVPQGLVGLEMPSRKDLYLCLGKKFRLFQGSRFLCSLGNHLPSLTDTEWQWHDDNQAAFHYTLSDKEGKTQ